jgi:two-component system phosphate regulon sensor histidine kinase PhoR
MAFWWRPLLLLVIFGLFASFVGGGLGREAGYIVLIILLLGYVWRQLWQEYRLARWLASGGEIEVPHDSSIWGDIFYLLDKRFKIHARDQRELSSNLEQFQHATEAVPDGMVILDAQGLIVWCNPATRKYLGLDLKRDQGQFIRYLLRQSQFLSFIDTADYSERLVCSSPINRQLTLSLQLVPFGEGRKLLMARDITELERVDRVRRDFVANVSHELRTPLTVVGGFVETLRDMPQIRDGGLENYFSLMQSHTSRMQRLLDDLLTLSRLESTDEPVVDENVQIPQLMNELVQEGLSLSGGRHGLRVETVDAAWLKGSVQELHSAFGNLVSNAVRYTPEGGDIVLRWQADPVRGGVFSVQDNGVGIAAEHIPRLTERFYRVDRSRSRDTGGTGLGLAIVKHILTRHDGHLEIRSTPGKGSTFQACFPVARLVAPQRPSIVSVA